MSNIQLINPLEGQKNWGPAINNNFVKLAEYYKSAISELTKLRLTVEQSDSMSISSTDYIYITENNIMKLVSYINADESDGWITPDSTAPVFDPDSYTVIGYRGWLVQTADPNGATVNGTQWHTGDLLLIKRELNTESSVIKQWPNIMGGYFTPVEHNITDNGVVTTVYNRTPSRSTTSETEVATPIVFWKPTQYHAENSQLSFSPYYIDSDGTHKSLNGINDQVIGMTYVTEGYGNYFTIPSPDVSFTTATTVVASNITSLAEANIDFEVYFRDGDHNMLYFPYTYELTADKKLKITFTRGTYTGTVYARLTVLKSIS